MVYAFAKLEQRTFGRQTRWRLSSRQAHGNGHVQFGASYKTGRIVWTLLTKGQPYRAPAQLAA